MESNRISMLKARFISVLLALTLLPVVGTVIIISVFEPGRNRNFYHGNVDRISITTLIFVIDVKKRDLLHIGPVATDTPSNSTSNPVGQTRTQEAMTILASYWGADLL